MAASKTRTDWALFLLRLAVGGMAVVQAFASDPAPRHTRLFNEFHALTVAVGKAHCGRTARCEGCPLADDLRRTHASE